MMIGSVSFNPVSPVAPAHQASVAPPADTAPSSAPGWATISRSGEILSKLQDLGQSDPAKLQAALGHIAQDLQSSAQGTGGSKAEALTELSSRFAQAASSGDLSALVGSAGHSHHHVQTAPAMDVSSGQPAGAAASSSPDTASHALLDSALAQLDHAMGMNPPPFGPWFTQ